VFAASGDHARSIEDYSAAIRLDAQYALAYQGRGDAYARTGQPERALKDYGEAIRLNPKNAYAYYSRGLAHAEKRDYQRAIEDMTEAVGLKPDFALALRQRGMNFQKLWPPVDHPYGFWLVIGAMGAVAVGLLGAITSLLGLIVLSLRRRRPLALFEMLGFRSDPVIALVLVIPLVVAQLSGSVALHGVDRLAIDAEQVERPDLEQAFADWIDRSDGCESTVDGVAVRPLVLVAAEGGGIRAATWTVATLAEHLETWFLCCPYPAGPNWASALEAAIRKAAQTLALGYNIKLVAGYDGQTIGGLGCTPVGSLTTSSTVSDAFAAAVALINGSASGGTTTQAQIGAMNTLLGCLNSES